MKTILLSAGLAIATVLPLAAQSPYPQQQIVIAGGTNIIAGASSNNYSAEIIGVPRATSLAVELNFSLMGAGTSAVGVEFQKRLSGSTNWTFFDSISTAANGTAGVSRITNLTVGPFTEIRVRYATNLNATVLTNLVLKTEWKPGL